jgi:hypothetical protein
VVQQQARAGEQLTMLERLSVEERGELRRLIAKAQGADEDIHTTAIPLQVENSPTKSST